MIPREVEEAVKAFGDAATTWGNLNSYDDDQDHLEAVLSAKRAARAALVAAIERAIDAKPAGEFVTRARYDEVAKALAIATIGHKAAEAERDRFMASYKEEYAALDRVWKVLGIATFEEAKEREISECVCDVIRARDRLTTDYDNLLTSWAECKEQRDRLAGIAEQNDHEATCQRYRAEAAERGQENLASALATAQARIEEARAHLGAALMQGLLTGDRMIEVHMIAAHAALSPATGTGSMPATEKGIGQPASDTGNRGPSGLHPAPAPSDYEAVCGATGRPHP